LATNHPAGQAAHPAPDNQAANFAVFVAGLAVISQKFGDVHKSSGQGKGYWLFKAVKFNMKYALSLSILDTNLVSIFDSTIYFRYFHDFSIF